jgi:starch phosphorylase
MKAQEQVSETYNEKMRFASMSLVNIAKSGIFSSDRSIREYCEKVWGVKIGK